MDKGIKKLSIVLCALLVLLAFLVVIRYFVNHPRSIKEGDNKFDLEVYDLEKEGLIGLKSIIEKSQDQDMSMVYNVAYFQIEVDKEAIVQSFTLSLDTYNDNGEYMGLVGYEYSADKKELSYSKPGESDDKKIIHEENKNSTLEYLDEQIRKIPLKEQLKVCKLERYVIQYKPYTMIESGMPIFDGRESKVFPVLDRASYCRGEGGISDGKTNVVFWLYDGSSQKKDAYLYVFPPLEEKTAVGNRETNMKCDYYMIDGKMKFTRNYGQSWFDGDITKEELDETLTFYHFPVALPIESIFLPTNKRLPIALFYGEEPKLKILSANSNEWKTVIIPHTTTHDFGRGITKRAIGFVSESFGYAALGTDWTMSTGESKRCYLTFDGGDTWTQKPLPLDCSTKTLIDLCMLNEEVGVVSLNDGQWENFPLIYVTRDGAENWKQIKLPYDDLGEGFYLIDIVSFKKVNGKYTLILGQENESVKQAVFTSENLTKGWKFLEIREEKIHTVG
ncbi:MAG: WD40/YVTN/BNR-like repeat-containing protein [Emergencia timonensis]